MRKEFAATLCAAAFVASAGVAKAAVTFVEGGVVAGTKVIVGSSEDADSEAASFSGAAGNLSASAISFIATNPGFATARNSVGATWFSANSGTVDLRWSLEPSPSVESIVSTNTAFLADDDKGNWYYTFITGATPAVFRGVWSLEVSQPSFGLGGIRGIGSAPKFISFGTVAPASESGMFSVNLAANTQYTFGIYNFGSVQVGSGVVTPEPSRNAVATLDWTITSVPEPSTWMMMILGFGLIAQQLRRRHRGALEA